MLWISQKINAESYVFILNMNGLAGSTSGWKGPNNVAITVDGQIIADRITSGILKSLNDKTWINMEDGSFNFADALKLVLMENLYSHIPMVQKV